MKSMVVLASAAASVDALTPAADEPAAEPKLLLIPWEYGGHFCGSSPDDPVFTFSEKHCGTDERLTAKDVRACRR
ncbi:hypothetical protein MGU_07013 [Metarhizium guizhouense ARSEF 977]|uniref:Chitinase n=1 Tax=Metarhizium guizhouense (strain ARSEF 977) TaxID=1276136 RepID=A0A0B4I0W9_METGA|nr:hypothetical protein MGU_07013 [Metarhizium guizhouense ARSEF 977]